LMMKQAMKGGKGKKHGRIPRGPMPPLPGF